MTAGSFTVNSGPVVCPSQTENNSRQVAIRRVLRLNEKKKLSGKHRGQKWIRAKQAECALYGHGSSPYFRQAAVCWFCGAKLD